MDYKVLRRAIDSVTNDLGYYVFFVKNGEIKDPDILEYYDKRISDLKDLIDFIIKQYPIMTEYPVTQELLDQIKKYYESTNKIKKNKESSWLEKTKSFLSFYYL
jgi:hypothetical protein